MKLATIALLGILLLGSFASIKAAGPAGASQVVIAYSGGSFLASDPSPICMFYPVLVGDLDPKSLFAGLGGPAIDKEHAYLIWVSDYSMQVLPPNNDFPDIDFLALVPTGTATIYYTNQPHLRDWRNLRFNTRSTWGEPVAKFVRRAGLFTSAKGGVSGTFTFTADLVSSSNFVLNGKPFNFRNLIPHGMTCSETGAGASEAGTCVAVGGGQ